MEKLHIHVINYRMEQIVYQATQEQVNDALARNSDIAGRIRVTIRSVERYQPADWTEADLTGYYADMMDADVLYGYTFPTRELRRYAPRLKWMQSQSSGVEQLMPFDWVPEGFTLTNSRGIHQAKSGESFAMYLGMLNAGIPRLFTHQTKGEWHPLYTSVIAGKTLVVIGVGSQGGELARQGKQMGMYVIGMDPYVETHPFCDEIVPFTEMQRAFARADCVALAAPLTEETRGLIGERELGWLPRHAGVINVARGPLMKESALSKFLHEDRLAGAILDVFDETPLPADSPLWKTPNLFISPHVSSDDPVHYSPLCLDVLMRNVRNYFAGKPLENVVNTKKAF